MIPHADLKIGDVVVYAKEHRGGYGYVTTHRARVVGLPSKRVRITLALAGRGEATRSVKPESLSWPKSEKPLLNQGDKTAWEDSMAGGL